MGVSALWSSSEGGRSSEYEGRFFNWAGMPLRLRRGDAGDVDRD